MNTRVSPFLLVSSLVALAAVLPATAQNATTTPVGVVTVELPATTQVTSTYFSIALNSEPKFSGAVASFTENSVVFSGTPFASGELAQQGNPYFLQIQTGSQAGRTMLILSNTANSTTLDITDNSPQSTPLNSPGFALSVGDRVKILPGDTIGGFFGDNSEANPLKLVGASSAYQADMVSIYNKTTSRLDAFFFSTTLGYWRPTVGTQNSNATIIYPDSGVIITRRAGRSALSISVLGEVPTIPLLTKTVGGNQIIYGSTRIPLNITLSSWALTGWTKSNSALVADTIGIYNQQTSGLDTYFQRTDGTWRKYGDTVNDQSSTVIPAGSLVAILKRASVTGQNSFLRSSLPYNLD